jgi:hypothetical protein
MGFSDSKRVTLSLWRASAMELLNALVRAHGALVWGYGRPDRHDASQRAHRHDPGAAGRPHGVTFYIANGNGVGGGWVR